ncbi:MAG: M28 family peptidase, partial [Candidatus Hermodarchaeota archaeon]|nr:M28 family peptidase [Candidatus Hermodarchaeota archaeon]
LEGSDQTFRNIEGFIGDGRQPELAIVSHHDTVENAPGADDNASAVAVMLEAARVLQEASWSGSVRFISFTLEEGNPVRQEKVQALERHYGIKDDDNRYTSWRLAKLMLKHTRKRQELFSSGTPSPQAIVKATAFMKHELSNNEIAFFQELEKIYQDVSRTNWAGKVALMGSSYWVEQARRAKKPVKGAICSDTIGYTSTEEHSQRYPKTISPSLFKLHGTNETLSIGDFLCVLGDQNSAELADAFCSNAQRESIKLPYACLQGAFSFDQIAQIMTDILRSDHAPFWRAGIPALFLTDSAEFRTPHYHRPSDTIDTLDFDFLTKICQTIVATTIELSP